MVVVYFSTTMVRIATFLCCIANIETGRGVGRDWGLRCVYVTAITLETGYQHREAHRFDNADPEFSIKLCGSYALGVA